MNSFIVNDGFGRMRTITRFNGHVLTEYREDGYYWAYPLNTSKGGNSRFKGPFNTRKDAKADEELKRKK